MRAGGGLVRQFLKKGSASLAACLGQKLVMPAVQKLGEAQIEPSFWPWGPVCMETQKQFPPAWPQFTATTRMFVRRAA